MIDRLRGCSIDRKVLVVGALVTVLLLGVGLASAFVTVDEVNFSNLDSSGLTTTNEWEGVNVEVHEEAHGFTFIYASGSGPNTIRVENDSGTVVAEKSGDWEQGDRINIVHDVKPGNYTIRFENLTSFQSLESDTLPKTSPGGAITVESTTDGSDRVYNVETIGVGTGTATLENPSPTQGEHSSPVTLSVDVDALDENKEYTVEFRDASDGTTIGSDTVTGSATASVSWDYDDSRLAEWDAVLIEEGEVMDQTGPHIINTQDPVVDDNSASPSGGGLVTETPVQLSIDVSDPDFDTAKGDSVEVEFYRVVDDGADELVGTHTLGQNGTATATMDDVVGGENQWYAVATDEYGGETTSETFLFEAPNEIRVVDEITLELIDDSSANVTVRFFREDSEEVVSREATNGTADMTGLPADAEFVVVADADGYEPRRVIVSSIVEQSTVYLLSESEPSVFNEFTLQDDTGNFPDGQTKLIIQKAITTDENNETQTFQTIAGDYFGATGTFPVVLAAQDRYRLIIENDAGQRRSLGAYTAEAGGPMPINVGQIEWPAPDQLDWGFSADYISDEDGTYIDIMYNDSSGDTSFLDLRVHERGNESNIIHEEATSDPSEFRVMVPLEGNQTQTEWVVEYTITRNGETSTYSYIVGGDHEWQLPFDSELMSLLGLIGAVVIMAAYPGPLAPVGGIVVVGVSGVLLLVGIINIPIGAWFLAGTIAVLGIVKAAEGVRFG